MPGRPASRCALAVNATSSPETNVGSKNSRGKPDGIISSEAFTTLHQGGTWTIPNISRVSTNIPRTLFGSFTGNIISAASDLPKKFGHRPAGDLRRYYEPAIEALAKHGVAFEMNTAGLRKAAGEIYPAFRFIELARQAGVPVLINSDAHSPEEVGSGFDAARELARRAGYTKVSRYEGRRRFEVDL
jgi:hypothetical protein